MMAPERAIAYHEPEIATLLIFAGFILSLNAISHVLDKLVYCGLVGQIFVGIAFGTPGLQWLPTDAEEVIVQIGYIGLVLLVYEGGLSTNLNTLKASLLLSSVIAITGIAAPIALSFVLQSMLPITSLQAFAAGAALCSTSLGTTFTVLQTSGLSKSKLGVVLAGAAIMDDVVGLVLVQVISSLGVSSSIDAAAIARPIGVSIAYATMTPIGCLCVVRPAARWIRTKQSGSWWTFLRTSTSFVFWCHTAILTAFVASSSYAGTSNLFAAYLAGACVSWWDSLELESSTSAPQKEPKQQQTKPGVSAVTDGPAPGSLKQDTSVREPVNCSGIAVFEKYFSVVLKRLLQPFFFASIGFSIPVWSMFQGALVWRGIVYFVLMALAKLVCGLWLIRLSIHLPELLPIRRLAKAATAALRGFQHRAKSKPRPAEVSGQSARSSTAQDHVQSIQRPPSLYPAALLGSAMVSRGEIGFLISAVAQANGLYTIDGAVNSSELFLIVTWAIMLCTILGPLTTGLLTKRVWRLQQAERSSNSGRHDPLGVWGVSK